MAKPRGRARSKTKGRKGAAHTAQRRAVAPGRDRLEELRRGRFVASAARSVAGITGLSRRQQSQWHRRRSAPAPWLLIYPTRTGASATRRSVRPATAGADAGPAPAVPMGATGARAARRAVAPSAARAGRGVAVLDSGLREPWETFLPAGSATRHSTDFLSSTSRTLQRRRPPSAPRCGSGLRVSRGETRCSNGSLSAPARSSSGPGRSAHPQAHLHRHRDILSAAP